MLGHSSPSEIETKSDNGEIPTIASSRLDELTGAGIAVIIGTNLRIAVMHGFLHAWPSAPSSGHSEAVKAGR